MPVHNWTGVSAGIFPHFHQKWIGILSDSLNSGLMPPDYYALAEQIIGDIGPDVLTLKTEGTDGPDIGVESGGLVAVAEALPQVRLTTTTRTEDYVRRQNHVVIRHSGGDRIVALIEVVSPGDKAGRQALHSFVDKAIEALCRGYHLLIIDLHPPGPLHPQGIHEAIWAEISAEVYTQPPDKPLTLAAYAAGQPTTAYVEPVAVGDTLPDMPLFLKSDRYVPVPLEATYQSAWHSVPLRWRRVLEGRESGEG